jgi:alpha-galactosidase
MSSNILFNPKTSIFQLYAGDSLYSFGISSSLELEHLYWGKKLAENDNLRNCTTESSTTMKNHFEKKRGYSYYDRVQDFLNEELTIHELFEEWRENQCCIYSGMPYFETIQRRRVENIAWRRMGMIQNLKTIGCETNQSCVFQNKIKNKFKVQNIKSQFPNEMLYEYSDHGCGEFCNPSFVVECENGSTATPLRYLKHNIITGKLPMPPYFPGIRLSVDEATTLVVTMRDPCSGLEIDLIYVCVHKMNVITRRVVFRNNGSDVKVIKLANSATVDVKSHNQGCYMTQLSGSWARERHEISHKLVQGMHKIGSTRGVSSHEHNPFAGVAESIVS